MDIPKLHLTDADYRATKSLLFLPPAPEAKSDSYAAQSSFHYYEYLILNHLRMCAAEDRRAFKHGLYTAEAIAQRRETAEPNPLRAAIDRLTTGAFGGACGLSD